jgi:hypothetical protein
MIKTSETANSYDVLLRPELIVTVDRIAALDDGDRVFKKFDELLIWRTYARIAG